MRPDQLIGLPYRLGADPQRHGAADCLSLTRTVLRSYGINSPEPERDWYRRLRQGDYSVFPEQLKRWGVQVAAPTLGTVTLCAAGDGYGLAVYWEGGCLQFVSQVVQWCPIEDLPVLAHYSPQKQNYATPSVSALRTTSTS